MATRFLISGGTGNWNDTSNWAATTGGASGASFPVAGDTVTFDSLSGNANMTVNVASACASLVMSGTYAGTLTFTSTLTLTSTCTLLSTCTIAGTAGTLILNGSTTLTSGGKTITCAVNFGGNQTSTLADSWTVNGLVTFNGGSTPTLNTNTLHCVGGVHQVSGTSVSGTTKLSIEGGTWDNAGTSGVGNNVDLAGNVTISGALQWGASGRTLKYVSGTITTTGSTITLNGGATVDTHGMTWNNLIYFSSTTYTLNSNLEWSGTLTCDAGTLTTSGSGTLNGTGAVAFTTTGTWTFNNTGGLVTTGTLTLPNAAQVFGGSNGFTVGTLTTATLTASRIYTLTFGNTYTVSNSIANVGTTPAITQSIKSSSAGNKVVFNLGATATCDLLYCNPTDVDSSGGKEVVTTRGTVTTSTNWVTTPTIPAVTDVRSGIIYNAGTGTVTLPAQANVKTGVMYGAGGTQYTGTVTLPAASNVKTGITYGAGDTEYTGTVTLPVQGNVKTGITYGAGGTEYTGSLASAGAATQMGIGI